MGLRNFTDVEKSPNRKDVFIGLKLLQLRKRKYFRLLGTEYLCCLLRVWGLQCI